MKRIKHLIVGVLGIAMLTLSATAASAQTHNGSHEKADFKDHQKQERRDYGKSAVSNHQRQESQVFKQQERDERNGYYRHDQNGNTYPANGAYGYPQGSYYPPTGQYGYPANGNVYPNRSYPTYGNTGIYNGRLPQNGGGYYENHPYTNGQPHYDANPSAHQRRQHFNWRH